MTRLFVLPSQTCIHTIREGSDDTTRTWRLTWIEKTRLNVQNVLFLLFELCRVLVCVSGKGFGRMPMWNDRRLQYDEQRLAGCSMGCQAMDIVR